MRPITKQGSGGCQLTTAHANPPQVAANATSRWRGHGHKGVLQQSLLDEQYYLCCYSEIRADQLALGYHIEHVQPKSAYPLRTFDYQNLAASALDSKVDLHEFKVQNFEVFGGHAKQDKYDHSKFVSCHQSDCARFFAYLSDGRVVPAFNLKTPTDIAKADYTIQTLNLNSPYLRAMRELWWNELDDLFIEHQKKGWSIKHLIALDLIPSSGKLSRFFSITRNFFGSAAEQVLKQQASHLV
jgi:uncharacterized protein (TIGR02646 family)